MNLPNNLSNPLFDRFWDSYPKGFKGSKQAAIKAWNKLSPNEKDTEMIITSVERQKKERGWRDGFGIPHCSTYLNQARFLDEPIPELEIKEKEIKINIPSSHKIAELPKVTQKTEFGQNAALNLRQVLRVH